MNKTKKMSILFATIGILAFSLIPAVSAGAPGHFKSRLMSNNLLLPFWTGDYTMEFSTSEDLFFLVGWTLTELEMEYDIAPKQPWKFKLFINDEEINLQRFDVKPDKTAGEIKASCWYHVFGPGYFEAEGDYCLRFEFWVKGPYQGDGNNYWRIWVDYWGIYLPAGTEFIFEYDLNIVA